MATPRDIADLLEIVAVAYPTATLSPRTAAVWSEMLGDIPADVLVPAVKRLLVESRFCPSIAEVRSAALDVREAEQPSAAEGWGEVIREIGRVGRFGSPRLSSLAAAALRCIGTWRDLCSSELDVMAAHRARFIQAYEGLARRERSTRLLPPSLRREIDERRAREIDMDLELDLDSSDDEQPDDDEEGEGSVLILPGKKYDPDEQI